MGASIVPAGAARARRARPPGTPSRTVARRELRGQRAVRRVVLGDHHQARGARDRGGARCPAAGRRRRPERSRTWWSSAFTSVPDGAPAPGWTTRPAGLSITRRCASSCTTASGMSSRLRHGRLRARARRPRPARPARSRERGPAGRAVDASPRLPRSAPGRARGSARAGGRASQPVEARARRVRPRRRRTRARLRHAAVRRRDGRSHRSLARQVGERARPRRAPSGSR